MKKHSLLSYLFAAGMSVSLVPSLMAATSVERDSHFWTVKRLIDKELEMVASPELATFKAVGYPEGDKYGDALRLLYCRAFQLDDPKLGEEIQGLEKSIGTFSDPAINELVSDEVNAAWVQRFSMPIQRELQLVLPAKKLGPEQLERINKRIGLLIDKTKFALVELEKKVGTNAADEEKYDNGELPDDQINAVIEKGIILRLEYANAFYNSYMALREVLYRGEEYGIDKAPVEAYMKEFIGTYEQIQKYDNWSYNYGDSNILLKHRLQIMLTEPVRTGHKYGNYDTAVGGMADIMDAPLDQFPSKFKTQVRALQLNVLMDVLYFHYALQGNREHLIEMDKKNAIGSKHRRGVNKERPNYAEVGIKMWERYYTEWELADTLRKDKKLTHIVAQAYFVAGNLYSQAGQVPKALNLIKEISDIKPRHFYYGNASRWKSRYMTPDINREVSFQSPVEMVDPVQILESVNDIFAEARSTENAAQRKKMFLDAAVSLRNAVYSLQDPSNSKLWFKLGPTAYYQLAYALYKVEMYDHAALISMEGAEVFESYFKRSSRNPFKNDKGEYNSNVEGLKKLVQNLSPYAAQWRRVDGSEAVTGLYRDAIRLLDVYKGIVPPPNPKSAIIVLVQEGEYDEALVKLDDFSKEKINDSDKIWCARIKAYCLYLMWDVVVKKSGVDSEKAKGVGGKLDAALADIDSTLEKLKDAKDTAEEASKAKQMKISISVGKAIRAKEWLKVLLALDDKYWENPPEESAILQRVAGQMCTASYYYHAELLKLKDAEKTIEIWPHLRRTLTALNLAKEKSGALMTNASKALAKTYKNIGTLADWFVENRGKNGVPDFNFGQMNKIVTQAPLSYGNLMWDLVYKNNNDLEQVRGVARTLQRGNDPTRAAILYEQYLTAVQDDAALMSFRDNPKETVDTVGDVIMASPLSSLKDKWGKVRDLMVDKPGFREGEYKDRGGTTEKLSEEKADYYLATQELEKMLKSVDASRASLGAGYEKLKNALTGLRDISNQLSIYYVIMDYTVQAYLAIDKMDNALPYIKALIAYDPIHPRYRSLNVEIVLRALGGNNPPSKEAIMDARSIAAEQMADFKGRPDKVKDYWLAYCQACELTAALGKPEEIKKINKSLGRHRADSVTPVVFDLAEDNGDETHTARDQESAGLIQRYLKLYDVKGITYPKPFAVSADEDQVMIKMVKE